MRGAGGGRALLGGEGVWVGGDVVCGGIPPPTQISQKTPGI